MGYRDFDDFDWYPRSTPRRVQGGIKARSQRGSIGKTWWSQRFIAVLESLGMGARLSRGRSYARRGQVLELKVAPGEVIAMVQGSRVKPYRVRIGVKALSQRDWMRAERAMASQAMYMAKLLSGEMPVEIEDAFTACRLSLFPTSRRQLASSCTCPDWANPCKHVAAAFYILAEAFDTDPFLVFSWRGRDKRTLIERLRALRGGTDGRSRMARTNEWARRDDAALPLVECLENFWEAGHRLRALRVRPQAAAVPDVLLRELGPPPFEVAGHNVTELLAPAYYAMSVAAERRALGDGSSGAPGSPAGNSTAHRFRPIISRSAPGSTTLSE